VFDDEHRNTSFSHALAGWGWGEQAYNTRHFTRVDRLLRATYLVDLTLAAMTGIGADDDQDVGTAAVHRKPSTPLLLEEEEEDEDEDEEEAPKATPKRKSGGKRKSAAAAANGNGSAKKASATKRTRTR